MTENIPRDDGLPHFTATSFKPGELEPIPLDKIHEQLIQQMTNMDAKEIENIADIIVGLVKQLRDYKN